MYLHIHIYINICSCTQHVTLTPKCNVDGKKSACTFTNMWSGSVDDLLVEGITTSRNNYIPESLFLESGCIRGSGEPTGSLDERKKFFSMNERKIIFLSEYL